MASRSGRDSIRRNGSGTGRRSSRGSQSSRPLDRRRRPQGGRSCPPDGRRRPQGGRSRPQDSRTRSCSSPDRDPGRPGSSGSSTRCSCACTCESSRRAEDGEGSASPQESSRRRRKPRVRSSTPNPDAAPPAPNQDVDMRQELDGWRVAAVPRGLEFRQDTDLRQELQQRREPDLRQQLGARREPDMRQVLDKRHEELDMRQVLDKRHEELDMRQVLDKRHEELDMRQVLDKRHEELDMRQVLDQHHEELGDEEPGMRQVLDQRYEDLDMRQVLDKRHEELAMRQIPDKRHEEPDMRQVLDKRHEKLAMRQELESQQWDQSYSQGDVYVQSQWDVRYKMGAPQQQEVDVQMHWKVQARHRVGVERRGYWAPYHQPRDRALDSALHLRQLLHQPSRSPYRDHGFDPRLYRPPEAAPSELGHEADWWAPRPASAGHRAAAAGDQDPNQDPPLVWAEDTFNSADGFENQNLQIQDVDIVSQNPQVQDDGFANQESRVQAAPAGFDLRDTLSEKRIVHTTPNPIEERLNRSDPVLEEVAQSLQEIRHAEEEAPWYKPRVPVDSSFFPNRMRAKDFWINSYTAPAPLDPPEPAGREDEEMEAMGGECDEDDAMDDIDDGGATLASVVTFLSEMRRNFEQNQLGEVEITNKILGDVVDDTDKILGDIQANVILEVGQENMELSTSCIVPKKESDDAVDEPHDGYKPIDAGLPHFQVDLNSESYGEETGNEEKVKNVLSSQILSLQTHVLSSSQISGGELKCHTSETVMIKTESKNEMCEFGSTVPPKNEECESVPTIPPKNEVCESVPIIPPKNEICQSVPINPHDYVEPILECKPGVESCQLECKQVETLMTDVKPMIRTTTLLDGAGSMKDSALLEVDNKKKSSECSVQSEISAHIIAQHKTTGICSANQFKAENQVNEPNHLLEGASCEEKVEESPGKMIPMLAQEEFELKNILKQEVPYSPEIVDVKNADKAKRVRKKKVIKCPPQPLSPLKTRSMRKLVECVDEHNLNTASQFQHHQIQKIKKPKKKPKINASWSIIGIDEPDVSIMNIKSEKLKIIE